LLQCWHPTFGGLANLAIGKGLASVGPKVRHWGVGSLNESRESQTETCGSKFWACHPLYFLSPKMSVKRKVRPHGFYVNLAQVTKKPGEHPVKRHFRSVGMKNKAVAAMVCIAATSIRIYKDIQGESIVISLNGAISH